MIIKDTVVKQVEENKGRVTRADVAKLLALAGKSNRKDLIRQHLGSFLAGEKHGRANIDSVLDDLKSYAEYGGDG